MHLGSRVSALLDGRLLAEEEERAWSHVHECNPCRDLVEREGWVKTQLAELSLADRADCGAPDRLKDSLLSSCARSSGQSSPLAASPFLTASPGARSRHRSLVAIGGGAAGAAVVGVLVLGTAGTPQLDRRAPSDLSRPTPSSNPTVEHRRADRPASRPSRRTVLPGSGSGEQIDRSRMTSDVTVVPQTSQVRMAP